MIREQFGRESSDGGLSAIGARNRRQPRRKIIRVTKKIINTTVFIIFEEEDPADPLYKIINMCPNVKLQF